MTRLVFQKGCSCTMGALSRKGKLKAEFQQAAGTLLKRGSRPLTGSREAS